MADRSFLAWPFFGAEHRALAGELAAWAAGALGARAVVGGAPAEEPHDVDAECRALVRQLGAAGWLRYAVPGAHGGAFEHLDVRALCLVRETLAHADGLADFAFAMQGLGAGPVSLFGSEALKARYLPAVARGEAIAAFALSEAGAGSDVGAMRTTAVRDGDAYVVDGEKTWISNAGIADHYVVFCRLAGGGDRAVVALVVDAGTPGCRISRRIDVSAPHPLGTVELSGCRVAAGQVVGDAGRGMRVALGTLDVFRSTVGAAALGFARRAADEALAHVTRREAFGQPLAAFQLTQARLAEMALMIDASALLVYRAAWTRDAGAERVTREAAMAKLYATEGAQQVVDGAVQLLGGRGVVRGETVERLYREVRALRIYEGTSEIQKLVIAGEVLKTADCGVRTADTPAGVRSPQPAVRSPLDPPA